VCKRSVNIYSLRSKTEISCVRQIGISGVLSKEYIWFTKGDEELGTSGAQIDLLIERRDRIINICEIKFSADEFIIDKEYDLKLRNKIKAFKRNTSIWYSTYDDYNLWG